MQYAGYAHLINQHNITAIPPAISVEVRAVTRKETIGQTIAVPAKLAPDPDDRLGHILFAIKHEGINLQVLAQALQAIPEPEIRCAGTGLSKRGNRIMHNARHPSTCAVHQGLQ